MSQLIISRESWHMKSLAILLLLTMGEQEKLPLRVAEERLVVDCVSLPQKLLAHLQLHWPISSESGKIKEEFL